MSLSDLSFVIRWWGLIFLIGISFLPLAYKIFPKFIDRGYLFSKVLGILVISYAIFVFSFLHIIKFGQITSVITWLITAGVFFYLLRNQKLELRKNIKLFLFEEILFFAAIFIWAIVRSFQPDIHDLEKFMDFGFINSIMRTDYFPPRDMWLTPLSINYYYFGHLYTAVLTKISAIPSYISFNLMLATVFAFCFVGTFSIGLNLLHLLKKFSIKRAAILGFLFSFVVTLGGNLQTIYSFFKGYNTESVMPIWKLTFAIQSFPNAYWYPNATRFIYHTIHEFPSYSFVVADLHGHVLDIPIVIMLIALSLVIFLQKKISLIHLVVISFLLAISYMTNAWDGLIFLLLFSLVILLNSIWNKDKREFKNLFLEIAKPILIFLGGFFLFTFLFNLNFSPFASGIGMNCSPAFLVKMGHIGPLLFENGQCQHSPWWQLLTLYGFPLYILLGFLVFLWKRKLALTDYLVLTLSIFSLFLIIIPEFFYLKDIYTTYFRANTMFKLSYQAFIMFGISSVYIIVRIVSSRKDFKTILEKIIFVLFSVGTLILLFLISVYPFFSIPSGYGELKKVKGLNGINYLDNILPGDYRAINWINKNISEQPVIAEAQGDSYTNYARISANTGLPTILGWTVHEWLWRGSYNIPSSRFTDISNLYESTSLQTTKDIIKKYDVKYIYIGGMEREKYNVNEEKFKKIGKLVYSNSQTKVYFIR
jgi:YYY domain-containing protein